MTDRRRPWILWAASAVLVLPPLALAVLVVTVPSELGGRFVNGPSSSYDLIGDAGDVDGDGYDDLWVSSGAGHRGGGWIPPWTRSLVRVVSGRDPARTLFEATSDTWLYGVSDCLPIGDVDGDGGDELLVPRARLATSVSPSGIHEDELGYDVLSITGGPGVVRAHGELGRWGSAVARSSLNGGRPTLFRGTPTGVEAIDPLHPGQVLGSYPDVGRSTDGRRRFPGRGISSSDAEDDLVLFTDEHWRGDRQLRWAGDLSARFELFDGEIAFDGDLNGDGVSDVCVYDVTHMPLPRPVPRDPDWESLTYRSEVRFHDGRTGEAIFRDIDVAALVPANVLRIVGAGDVDGDGRDELAVHANGFFGGTAELAIVSVQDAEVLRRLGSGDAHERLQRVGDLDGDGERDLALVARDGDALAVTLWAAGSLEVLGVWRTPSR